MTAIPEIRFYHLERQSFEQTLLPLLFKVLETGRKAVVRVSDVAQAKTLSEYLWTSDPAAFLPHGIQGEAFSQAQPIWITSLHENPAGAEVLIVAPGVSAENQEGFSLCCEMLDGHDADALAAARARWKTYKDAGHQLTYWQQTPDGWEKKQG